MIAEMENRGRQNGRGMAVADAGYKMVERTNTARGDHWHRDGIGHGAGQRDIIARFGAVTIHRGEEDFASTEGCDLAGIINRIDARWLAAPMGKNLPARRFAIGGDALGINGDDDTLIAEFISRAGNELPVKRPPC